ncbi:M56 family metallopeptidase [Konateibacter massiliensis]|uniref:M56 family metallopeptidase n=1 Tax=Konateibacter massiliensis TaxID=2002841 RepID=UPI000C153066|nr:M56 family metallopeptidase [Konateibacter massiliensis]
MAEIVFATIIEKSMIAGFIILVLKTATPILSKRYTAKYKYFIWLLIALYLIIPIQITIDVEPIKIEVPVIEFAEEKGESISESDGQHAENDSANIGSAEAGTEQVQYNINTNTDILSADTKKEHTLNTQKINVSLEARIADVKNDIKASITLINIMLLLWMIGALIFFAYHLFLYKLQKKMIFRWQRPRKSDFPEQCIKEIAGRKGIKKLPSIIVSEKVPSPMLIGLFKQYLVLPCENYTKQELDYILHHELVHFRRHDLWYKLILLLANAVHWFNPLVYIMRKEADMDIELSCDDEVMRDKPLKERQEYAETILVSIQQSIMRKNALNTCLCKEAKAMKIRLRNIISSGKKYSGKVILGVVFFLVITAGSVRTLAVSEEVLDYVIIGARPLSGEDWYNRGKQIANGTKASSSAVIEGDAPPPVTSDILSEEELEDFFAVTVTNISTEQEDGYYKIPDIITNSADMAIFTKPDGKGWYLEKGQTIEISFRLDQERVATANGAKVAVEIGYIFNGSMYKMYSNKEQVFSVKMTAENDGEYFLYTTNRTSGYEIMLDGRVNVE